MTELHTIIGCITIVAAVILTIGGSFLILVKLCDKFL